MRARLSELRAPLELASLVAVAPLLELAPRGDGQPVLVLPGLGAGDRSTAPLRVYLATLGYRAYGWDLGVNVGVTGEILERLPGHLAEIHHRHGRAVSLVGWSLGGVYARALAHRGQGVVRQVVTLGSPVKISSASPEVFADRFEKLAGRAAGGSGRPRAALWQEPLPVPSTAVYSKSDGIVPWEAALQPEGPHQENVEVRSSHLGLGVNPSVLLVVADRLSQPEGRWSPWRPARAVAPWYPGRGQWQA